MLKVSYGARRGFDLGKLGIAKQLKSASLLAKKKEPEKK